MVVAWYLGWTRFGAAQAQAREHGDMCELFEAEGETTQELLVGVGGSSSVWTTDGCTLWGHGTPMYGEFGSPATIATHRCQIPLECLAGARVRHLSCGPHHCMAVIERDGKGDGLVVWGQNLKGMSLGVGSCGTCSFCARSSITPSAPQVLSPRPVTALAATSVLRVATGANHTLAILEDGRALAWGDGSSGQLGYGDAQQGELSSCTPRPVQWDGEPLIDGAAGLRHSLLLTSKGRVLSFGSGLYHALGHGDRSFQVTPRVVRALEGLGEMKPDGAWSGIKAIAAGGWHSAALTTTGDLYVWGWNKHGQLGDGSPDLQPVPALLCPSVETGLVDIAFEQVGCGHRYTAALSGEGMLLTFGCLGLVGEGSLQVFDLRCKTPRALNNQTVGGMTCGPWHLVCWL